MPKIADSELFSDLLIWICRMPFIATSELACGTVASVDTLRRHIRRLRDLGLIDVVRVGTSTVDAAPRYYPTLAGIASAAESEGMSLQQFRRGFPVSREWLEVLLERLDSVILCYRLSQLVARLKWPHKIHISRTRVHEVGGLYDCVLTRTNGQMVGVIRHGTAIRESGLQDILDRLEDVSTRPGAVLVLCPTRWHRQWVADMVSDRELETVYLATERAAVSDSDWHRPIWYAPCVGTGKFLTLEEILKDAAHYIVANEYLAKRAARLAQERGSEWDPLGFVPTVSRARAAMVDPQRQVSQAPAANLSPAEKRVLEAVAACPRITRRVLGYCVHSTKGWISRVLRKLIHTWGLVEEVVDRRDPRYRRLILSERGIEYVAGRDRVHLDVAREMWSLERDDAGKTMGWLTSKAQRLWVHQDGVYESIALLGHGGDDGDCVLWSGTELRVGYMSEEKQRVITPDTIGALISGDLYIPFFLEFERTAVHPSRIPGRLARYRLFFRDRNAVATMAPFPIVLFSFHSESVEHRFLEAIADSGFSLPVLTSNLELLREVGGMGDAWRAAWPPFYLESAEDELPETRGWGPLTEPRLGLRDLDRTAWFHSRGRTVEFAPHASRNWPPTLRRPDMVRPVDQQVLTLQ